MRYHYENLCILYYICIEYIEYMYMYRVLHYYSSKYVLLHRVYESYGVWFTGTLYIVFENRDGHGVMRPAISDQTYGHCWLHNTNMTKIVKTLLGIYSYLV